MANPARPVTGQVIDTAWGLNVADSVVRVYPNAATRDADLVGISSAELLGQACVLTDTGTLQVYAGAVMGWRRPWGQPWGSMATPLVSTLDVTGSASFQSVLSAPMNADLVAGRLYRASGVVCYAASAPGQARIKVAGIDYINRAPAQQAGAGEHSLAVFTTVAQGSSAPAAVIDLGMVGPNVNPKGSFAPHRLVLEDIGPSANPTALILRADATLPSVDLDSLEPAYRALHDDQAALEREADIDLVALEADDLERGAQ